LSHCRLLGWSSALDWVGGQDAPPPPTIWQAGKTSLRYITLESLAADWRSQEQAPLRKERGEE
jgi:hypothetical protein